MGPWAHGTATCAALIMPSACGMPGTSLISVHAGYARDARRTRRTRRPRRPTYARWHLAVHCHHATWLTFSIIIQC